VVVWVLFGGLLDGDWSTLTTLAAVLCTGVTAASVPSRIDAARVQ
jgi:glycerol-3-phosphate acyltransferase PlsY